MCMTRDVADTTPQPIRLHLEFVELAQQLREFRFSLVLCAIDERKHMGSPLFPAAKTI